MVCATKAIEELFSLAENDTYTMAKFEWWLLKYNRLYERLSIKHDFNQINKNFRLQYRAIKEKDEVSFLENYWDLDRLSVISRHESDIKRALEDYELIKNDDKKTQLWIDKNYLIFDVYYADFLFENLSLNETFDNIRVFLLNKNHKKFCMWLPQHEFLYTVKFIDLYWDFYCEIEHLESEIENAEIEKRKELIPKVAKSIQSLNFEELEALLPGVAAYDLFIVSVPEFIEKLKKTMSSKMYNHIKTFDKLEEHPELCDDCFDGTVYRFIYKNKLALDLCFTISLSYYIVDIFPSKCKFETASEDKIEKIQFNYYGDDAL